ncbi:MAG: glutaredoxin [Halioglobus sp.]
MTIIRLILGNLILLLNWMFTPRSIQRNTAQQALIDTATADLTLYQYRACPFCVKVRRQMKRQSLNIRLRDVKRDAGAREELLAGGGELMVPCLRIQDAQGQAQWLYESSDIVHYLETRFALPEESEPTALTR